ncbi:MAG TPA: serine/threonine-protein kinase [Bryobacteraceae bacterium]|jgi:serine/threonine-protein kinase
MGFEVEHKVGFQVGQTAGNYEFLELLNSSANEVVYKVRNHLTQRLEALKVLATDAGADHERVERFIREIKVHARLTHPNIVTFYNAAELEGQLVMTMELVNGITLAERVQLMGSLTWVEAVSHTSQILLALAFAHEQGIIHRNVTPETIIITADTTVKLAGFDLAKPMASPSLTQAGSVLGALKYIPPEQIRGVKPLDARSDLYSVGAVLYEALVGRLPFDTSSQFKLMMDHVNTDPPAPSSVNPKVPQEFDAIVLKALAKDPADRFQSADEFRARLEAAKKALRSTIPFAPAVTAPEPAEAPVPAQGYRELQPQAAVPSFAFEATAESGGRNMPLLMLVSSLVIAVVIALVMVVAR